MSESVRTLVGFHLRAWIRSRGPIVWALFLLVWGWFNWETFRGDAEMPWWGGWAALAAWLGFLAGYDTYARMREAGTLRLILLNPAPRTAIAASFWIGSGLLVGSSLLVFLAFVTFIRPVPPELGTVIAVLLVLSTAAAFIAYAQLASLVMPRDTAAVLGLLVVIVGATAHDFWIPLSAPAWVEPVARLLFLALPTTHRLTEALAGGPAWGTLAILAGQITLPLVAINALLGRTALTRRPKQ